MGTVRSRRKRQQLQTNKKVLGVEVNGHPGGCRTACGSFRQRFCHTTRNDHFSNGCSRVRRVRDRWIFRQAFMCNYTTRSCYSSNCCFGICRVHDETTKMRCAQRAEVAPGVWTELPRTRRSRGCSRSSISQGTRRYDILAASLSLRSGPWEGACAAWFAG